MAPRPGLNIYYVLFGLWGKGARTVASIPSCGQSGAGPGARAVPEPVAQEPRGPSPRGEDSAAEPPAAVTDLGYRAPRGAAAAGKPLPPPAPRSL